MRAEWLTNPTLLPVAEMRGPKRVAAVMARNLYWGRTHGWSNLLEEHDLRPLVRFQRQVGKWRWRMANEVEPGSARPVFLVGAQRSGTNMVTHGLSRAPEFEVFNEGDRRAFANYRLKDTDLIEGLVDRSRHAFVLFKPLADTHRLLDLLTMGEGRARGLWVYRDVRQRVISALAKFGDSNLRVLKHRADDPGFSHWQLGDLAGLSPETAAIVDRFETDRLSPADGAALFWLIRNRLFFELGLDRREDVLLVSYDAFVDRPVDTMEEICEFLSFPYHEGLVSHVRPQSGRRVVTVPIAAPILELCDDLSSRLDRAAAGQVAR